MSFVLTELQKEQLTSFETARQNTVIKAGSTAIEAYNPWPAIVLQIVDLIKHIPVGWGSHDEIVTDFIETDYSGDLYSHLKNRYDVGSMNAFDMCELLNTCTDIKQFA